MNFQQYQDRNIAFHQCVRIEDWHTKVYTISYKSQFGAAKTLAKALEQLPDWLALPKQSKLPTHQFAFLIVHEGRDGTWVMLYWWTGGEMLGSSLFFAKPETSENLQPNPHPHYLVCVWELEVIAHERAAWIRHILSKADAPDTEAYLQDFLEKTI